MTDHGRTLDQVVRAAEQLLPKKAEADRILREIQRLEAKDQKVAASNTSGETEPED